MKCCMQKMIFLFALLLGGSMFLLIYPFYRDTIYPGVILAGVDMSGKSREEALAMLTFWKQKEENKTIDVYFGATVYRLDANNIDFSLDIEETLQEIMRAGHTESWWAKVKNIGAPRHEGYRIPMKIRYNESKLGLIVNEWEKMIDRPPRNATVNPLTGELLPQELGCKLESEKLRRDIIDVLAKPGEKSAIAPLVLLRPNVTVEDIKQYRINQLLSTYTTSFNEKDENRTVNIRRAAESINGYLLKPKEVFSFNGAVGPRTKTHGFKEALEIVDNQFVPGIGGGVCQVSSTLYNAALLAGMEIVERVNHSRPLTYVPLGRDATVVFDNLDFKFLNNSSSILMIAAQVEGNKLHIGILGQHRLNECIELVSTDKKEILPTVLKKDDQNLFIGESKIDKQGNPGYEITTFRVFRQGEKGREIRRELIAKDRYAPEDVIVKVGTKLPPFVQVEQLPDHVYR